MTHTDLALAEAIAQRDHELQRLAACGMVATGQATLDECENCYSAALEDVAKLRDKFSASESARLHLLDLVREAIEHGETYGGWGLGKRHLLASEPAAGKCIDCRHYWERKGRCTKAIDPNDPRKGGPGRPWSEPTTCAPPWCPGFENRPGERGP